MPVEYVTVSDVELGAIGLDWPAGGGTLTLTLEHLVDCMVAANDDPLIRPPRIKLGHTSMQPNADGLAVLGDFDPFWNGAPAFGTVRNLRLNDHGSRLLGDLVEVPDWLATAIPSAWPNRSCEWVPDVQTEGGRRYSMVITACALLGEQEHAIRSLADVQRLVEHGPDS